MSVEEKINALHTAKILSVRAHEACTRVLVSGEDVQAVIAAMNKPRAPVEGAAPKAPRAPRAPQTHTGEPSKTTLFVANLPFAVDDAGLLEIFEGQKVKEARVAVRRDGRSRGYGFVTFENEADMQTAQKVVDKTLVDGREVSVRVVLGEMGERKAQAPREKRAPRVDAAAPAVPLEASKTVAFVGNLPFTVDDAALQKLFTGYAIKEAKVSVRPNGRSKGYALVTFENEADQARAITALNGSTVEGRQIHVLASTKGSKPVASATGSAAPRAPRAPKAPRVHREPTGEPSKTALFVANLPFVVDDNGLLQIFEGFQVKEAHVATRANGKSCGFGFVSFETEAEATRALSVVDKSIVEGREIAVRPAHSAPTPKAAAPAAAAPAPAAAAPAAAAPAAAAPTAAAPEAK